jgi:hypothetical protein
MKLITFSAAFGLLCVVSCGSAAEEAMTRVLACTGDDASMEVYIPQSAVAGRSVANVKLDRPITGAYTLDLTAAEKGKVLEPVRVSLSPDKKFVIVDQYTRRLPPTRVPVNGGTVNFDNRFGTNAKCRAFNSE